jgi:hypothetical protein
MPGQHPLRLLVSEELSGGYKDCGFGGDVALVTVRDSTAVLCTTPAGTRRNGAV